MESSYWPLSKRIAFRFLFIFFLLIICIQNNGAFPFWSIVVRPVYNLLEKIIPWVGKNILELNYAVTYAPSGSGDTTYDWITIFIILVISVIGTMIWSILDRKTKAYSKLYYYLSVAVRFYVGLMLINYGLVKIFKLQFPAPQEFRLMQAYGESSPMGLAWTFLGFSKGYNFFMGIAEVSAVLLLFRRTLTIGAIITLMTTANVMAVNFFYDVPVKILSTTLVSMALFLLLYNAHELWQIFIKHTPAKLSLVQQPTYSKPILIKIAYALKYLLLFNALIIGGYNCYQALKVSGDNAAISFKYQAIYDVKKFIRNGDTIAPLLTDTAYWKRIIIPGNYGIRIEQINNNRIRLNGPLDTVNQIFHLNYIGEKDVYTMLEFKEIADKEYRFAMRHRGDSIIAITHRIEKKTDYLLLNRGFHWVNEVPFNR